MSDPLKETPMAELDRDNVVNQAEPPPAEPPPAPPQNGNGKTDHISDSVRKAREDIPVGEHGITPKLYEHQVTIAKDRSKAYAMLPEFLRNNAPVMAALVGLAARFDLEPAMVASQTYMVPGSDRLCFTSQAFGAFLYASKVLVGRLRYEYRGEGDDLTCTVSGRFVGDPDTIYSATSPTLKQVRPPRNDKGVVKGSPLYDKDPEQQLGYFAQRRWMRRYTPDVCLGMYTREEMEDTDEFRANRSGAIPLTPDRLGQLDTGEGWGEGAHVDLDLASIGREWPTEQILEEAEPAAEPEPERPARPAPRKPTQTRKPAGRTKSSPPPKSRPGKPVKPSRLIRGGRAPSKVAINAAVKRAEMPPRRVAAQAPKWLDYVQATEVWIKAVADAQQGEAADSRWETERDLRDQLQVPMGERSRLRAILDRKVVQFSPKRKDEDEA